MTTTWAMKMKSNGVFRARLNMRGFEAEDGVHYDSTSTAAPVTNEITIRLVMTLAIMTGWIGQLVDVKGAFLHGEFENGEEIYTEIPQGFHKYWNPEIWVWLLTKTIYGLPSAAIQFWNNY